MYPCLMRFISFTLWSQDHAVLFAKSDQTTKESWTFTASSAALNLPKWKDFLKIFLFLEEASKLFFLQKKHLSGFVHRFCQTWKIPSFAQPDL